MRVLLLLAFAFALMGQRDPILVPEVSQHEVQVRQGFTGTELLLFGAVLDPQGRAAGSETASSAHRQRRIFFMIYWSGVRTPTVSSKLAQSAWSAV